MNNKRYIGIDLGGTKIAAGLVDDNGHILKKVSAPTLAHRAPEEIAEDMANLAKSLMAEFSLTPSDIEFLGVGTPGIANTSTGLVDFCSSLPFVRFPLVQILKDKTGIADVDIENDANAAAKAEHVAGAAKGYKDSVMITLGTGVGGGVIIDNKILTGCNFSAAELGHIVIQHNGRQCKCGRKGCWETYSSATGLVNITKDRVLEARAAGRKTSIDNMIGGDLSKVSARTAFAAMKTGDAVAAEIVDEYISYLACGIVNTINIFHPDVLSIGGGVCNEGDYLLKPLFEKVWSSIPADDSTPKCEIKIAMLGNDAGIIGAAVLGK